MKITLTAIAAIVLMASCSKTTTAPATVTPDSLRVIQARATVSVFHHDSVYVWRMQCFYSDTINENSKVVISWNNGTIKDVDTLTMAYKSDNTIQDSYYKCSKNQVATNVKIINIIFAGNHKFSY